MPNWPHYKHKGRTPKPEWKAGVQACVIKALAALRAD